MNYNGSERPILLEPEGAQFGPTWRCESVHLVFATRKERGGGSLTVFNDVYGEFLERVCTPIQYLLTMSPVNVSKLNRTEVYTIR